MKSNDVLSYGGLNDLSLARSDDDSKQINLNFKLYLYNTSYDSVYVCVNGFISFISSNNFRIADYSSINYPVVGALSVDLDTREKGNIYYRETTELNQITSIKKIIQNYFNLEDDDLNLNSAFIVTYDNVPLHGDNNKYTRNTFQIILASSKNCESFAIIGYKYLNDPGVSYAGYSSGYGVYRQIPSSDL